MFGEEENSNSLQPTVTTSTQPTFVTSTIPTFGIPRNPSANIQSLGNPANAKFVSTINPSFGIPRNPNAHIPTDQGFGTPTNTRFSNPINRQQVFGKRHSHEFFNFFGQNGQFRRDKGEGRF